MRARDEALAALTEHPYDVLVIGGGITGAGVALDAASRATASRCRAGRLRLGHSSRSSKLVHGGLRYLQNFDLGLVREALLERQLMVRLAPHLVRPLPFVLPAFDGAPAGPADRDRAEHVRRDGRAVAARAPQRPPRRGGRRRVRTGARPATASSPARRWPSCCRRSRAREPSGGYLFYDCQTDDARLVLTVLGEAERFGAVCANRLRVTELRAAAGQASGVVVEDREGGGAFTIRAANVVNATGVWADRIRPGELHSEAELPQIAPAGAPT